MTKQHILITGGAGSIGSQLSRRLSQDFEVLVLDDLSSGNVENLRDLPVKFVRGSVVDDEILHEVFEWKPEVVYHLAANFANQNSVDYPQKDLSVNGLGTLKVLQFAARGQVRRFIYTSSSCVYGNAAGPISEEGTEFSLDTPYAVTKRLGEHYTGFFHQRHRLPTVILRLFNSYGPGEYPGKYRNVIPNFIARALAGKPLVITGSGAETRDYTYVEDTVQALMLSMTQDAAVGMTFNTGTGKETSIQELAQAISDLTDRKVKIEYMPKRDWDTVNRRCANISRIRDALGYQATTDLRAGLQKTYDWFTSRQFTDAVFP
jgi:nucleoside-diphosphate-sugar epimerase